MSTDLMWQTQSANAEKTELLGELLAARLEGGDVVELAADLGGGKTTFVKGVARGLGVKATITSPTFTISRSYETGRALRLYHFDFYRLEEPGIIKRELSEAMNSKSIVAVEWGKQVESVMPPERLRVEFSLDADDTELRHIKMSYRGTAWTDKIDRVQGVWQP